MDWAAVWAAGRATAAKPLINLYKLYTTIDSFNLNHASFALHRSDEGVSVIFSLQSIHFYVKFYIFGLVRLIYKSVGINR